MIWIPVIGLVAGFVARLVSPEPNKPSGFILAAALGIAGALLATGRLLRRSENQVRYGSNAA